MDAIRDALLHINLLDVAIMLTLIIGMLVGYGQGAVRQLVGLIALYISIVVSARFNSTVALLVKQVQPQMLFEVAQVIAFFILMFVLAGVLSFFLADLVRRRFQQRLGPLSHLLGGLIGLLGAVVFISVSLIALVFMTANPWPGSTEAVRGGLLSARLQSNIVPLFRPFFSLLLQSIKPWVPDLPPLFSIDIQLSP